MCFLLVEDQQHRYRTLLCMTDCGKWLHVGEYWLINSVRTPLLLYREKIESEMKEVSAEYDGDFLHDVDALGQLKYTEAFVQEALRISQVQLRIQWCMIMLNNNCFFHPRIAIHYPEEGNARNQVHGPHNSKGGDFTFLLLAVLETVMRWSPCQFYMWQHLVFVQAFSGVVTLFVLQATTSPPFCL